MDPSGPDRKLAMIGIHSTFRAGGSSPLGTLVGWRSPSFVDFLGLAVPLGEASVTQSVAR